ncbi:MAG: hypothetical protein LC725_03125, partial [Lentisphaerae bacterium]|nr:hypothetical protein [Lentisphaerota bacterium]
MQRHLRAWMYGVGIIVVFATFFIVSHVLNLPRPTEYHDTTVIHKEHTVTGDAAWDISIFQPVDSSATQGDLARRYRLAGTFFAVAGSRQSRKAIIDDLEQRDQKLLGEGDVLGSGIVVSAIHPDHIILRSGKHEERLSLSFASTSLSVDQTTGLSNAATEDMGMLSRFGKRVEDRRWLLNRSALLDYYQEVMSDTERLTRIFASLKPVYQESRISGYVLDIEGEAEMFHAFGLRQNDVIRTVNSMPMT